MLALGTRVGFALLVAALVAFEVMFVSEARAGAASLAAERSLRESRATEALEADLVRLLDVGEARIEALETLPLLEDDGLTWHHEGVQWLPRVPGLVTDDAKLLAVTQQLDALLTNSPEAAAALVLRSWPLLPKKTAAEWCVRVQRALPANTDFTAACQRGLQGALVTVTPTDTPSLQGRWLVVRREGDVRGVEVDLPAVLARLQDQLHKRATLEPGDALALVTRAPLPAVTLISPRLDDALAAQRRAFTLKTLLLALTALLGLGVVWLARLAERRREETLRLQREFISTVSHELRTPLAAIRVMAETLERKLPTDGPAKDYPHRLVAAADGLTFLVDNILSFNRLESGRLTPRKQPFAFTTLEAWLAEDARLALDVELTVRCEGLAALPTVQADGDLLRVLVSNLLRNAWKYATRRPVRFVVSAQKTDTEVVVRFTDNGPGIPPEAHERVFEAFHRLEREGNAGGSGLGLAVGRRIARLHGGSLIIASSSSEGTCFELRLPADGGR